MSKSVLLLTQVPANNLYKYWHKQFHNEKHLSLTAIYCYFLKPFTAAYCGGNYLLEVWSQGVTQYMTVTVGLTGNATTAMRFIAAVLPNALNVEGKGHQNAPVLLFPHIAQFSAVRFQQYAKGPRFFQCSWEGWPGRAAVHGRDTGRLCVRASLLNDPSNLHFATLFTGAASPRLAAKGISVGEGLLSAQLAERRSSKRVPPTSFPVKQQN